ncbi:hypothetical protein BV25DRAFT_1822133 [Artomyces pyxidatus]|uniref:Uncharacterized protein n=1 Tax=Artomyces pyxidatus TaxID=48021 RepID=A0ACB8TAG3_9AGAM|nr:hypothetical protein BV25DRAFT_1822133 [Artomyces pyxidatus]
MASRFYPFARTTTSQARDVVRNIIRSSATPLSTRDIFKQAVQQATGSSASRSTRANPVANDPHEPPYPDHAIRSMTYLKTIVLPELLGRKEIEKIHMQRTLSAEEIERRRASMTKAAQRAHANDPAKTIDSWVWKAREFVPKAPVVKQEEPVFGVEVGVGEDWGHLNRRRRRAREMSVKRDVKWMRKLQRAKQPPPSLSELPSDSAQL